MTTDPGTAPEAGLRRIPWRGLDAGWAILAGLLASLVARQFVGLDASTTELFGIVVPIQAVVTLLTIAALAPRREDWRPALRLRLARSDGWGVMIGIALQFALAGIAYLIVTAVVDGDVPQQAVVLAAADAIGRLDRVLVAIGLVVLAPISEEVVYRGVLLRSLEHTGSPRRAVLLSSLVFAGLHLVDPNAVVAVPSLFVLGLVLGAQTIRTGRLGRAIAIHAGFNLVTVIALLAV